MDIRKFVQQTAEYSYNSVAGGLGIAGAGVGYVTELVGSLRFFGSTTEVDANIQFDERHYFLVPDSRNAEGYSLVVTRCLPEGVPPINELPKRRILHLPNDEADLMLRTLLIRQAQADELARPSDGKTMAVRARELANYIDALDERVFGGVLLIGGLVGIFNPLAGAAIAAKTLLPSLGLLASKYGLRVAEESLSHADMQKRAKQAEKDVLRQFRATDVDQYTNPVLRILERATRTTEEEFDSMLELHEQLASESTEHERRWLRLAAAAVLDVFDADLKSKRGLEKAGLGPEDLRFMQLLGTLSEPLR